MCIRTRLAGGGYGLGGGWATFSSSVKYINVKSKYMCVHVKKDTVGRWWVGAGGWWATYALHGGEGLPIGMGRPTGKPGGWFFQPGTKVPDFQLYIEEVLLNHFSRWDGFLKMSFSNV